MLLSACATQTTTGGPSSASPVGETAATGQPRSTGESKDWTHVLQVLADLKASPPAEPVVVLLGGSAARECTIGDAEWAAQVQAAGGPAAATYNLGSRNRTLAQDVQIVRALPPGTLVFIGINVGRFTAPPSSPTITLPAPTTSLPPYDQHKYSSARILSAAEKRTLQARWLGDRFPYFQRNYATNARTLEQLIAECERHRLHPVLLDLPRNMAIIRQSLARPIARYTATCSALAKEHRIPTLAFVAAADLRDGDFYDLWHLVEPGRAKWQALLSARTATLLRTYGAGGAAD
jgi:hypothetical protein